MVGIQELVFLRDGIFVPARDFFAFVFERQSQAELRPNAIAVRTDMPDHANGLAIPNGFNYPMDDFRLRNHGSRTE